MTTNSIFSKNALLREAILLYLSLLERKSFVKLKKTIVLLSCHVNEAFLLFQGLIRDEKLREVSVSYFFRTENYNDVVNYKTFSKSPPASLVHCIQNVLSHSSGKWRNSLAIADMSSTNGCSEFHLCTIFIQ